MTSVDVGRLVREAIARGRVEVSEAGTTFRLTSQGQQEAEAIFAEVVARHGWDDAPAVLAVRVEIPLWMARALIAQYRRKVEG